MIVSPFRIWTTNADLPYRSSVATKRTLIIAERRTLMKDSDPASR
jgi:hypothetical protein